MPTHTVNEAAIDLVCLRTAYRAMVARSATSSIAAGVVAWIISREVPGERMWVWLAVVWLLSVLRGALGRWFHSRPRTDEEVRRFLPAFTVSQTLSAVPWGALIAVVGFTHSLTVITPMLLGIGGMMSGGAYTVASTPRVMVTSVAVSLTPVTVFLAVSGDPQLQILLLLVGAHVLSMLDAVKVNSRGLRDSIAVRFENEALVEQLRVEQERERAARRDADRANLEKSRFLASAGHDARQPLHALGLFVDTLKAQPLEDRARRLVSSIELAHGSLVSLHEGLLDVSVLDVGSVVPRPRAVRAKELLGAVHDESAPRARLRGLELHVRAPELAIDTDPALVLRMLRNLVANALTYTERGRVVVAVRRRAGRALFQVWDTGVGIAPEEQPRIFEELYQVGNRARDRRQGLGLGLAIVRRLAAALGSEVTVRSTVGRGSVFSFSLPLAARPPATEATEIEPQPPAAKAGRGEIALVVDDDALAREALSSMLEHWGYEVVAAQSADQALDYAARLERVDVVISDLWLPGRSGLELLAELKSRLPRAVRVAISGDTDPKTEDCARDTGASFVRKPVRAVTLRDALTGEAGRGAA